MVPQHRLDRLLRVRIERVARRAGVEPAGDAANFGRAAPGEHVVVQAGGQAEFVGVGVPPFFDDGGQNFGAGPARPAAEGREFIEDVEGGNVAAGKFAAQAAEKTVPPIWSLVGNHSERMVGTQVRQQIIGQPLLRLLGPVTAGTAVLRDRGFRRKLQAHGRKCGLAPFALGEIARPQISLMERVQKHGFGGLRGSSGGQIGGAAGGFVSGLGGGLAEAGDFGGAIGQRPEPQGGTDFGDEGDGKHGWTAQETGATRTQERLDHTPLGERLGPGINAEGLGHVGSRGRERECDRLGERKFSAASKG